MIVPNVCYLLQLLLKTNCFITEVNYGLLNCITDATRKFENVLVKIVYFESLNKKKIGGFHPVYTVTILSAL